jgi:hypothetical protein
MIALAIGALLALAVLAYVLYPIFVRAPEASAAPPAPAPSSQAIGDEIEAAVRAYRENRHDRCAACGTPVDARNARYCPNCGSRLQT